MGEVAPGKLPEGRPEQPSKEPSLLTRRLGRFIEWFQNFWRSDDEKIEAIAHRAEIFPSEREWALHHLAAIQNTLQKRIDHGSSSDNVQQTLIKTQQAVSAILYPDWTASHQAKPEVEGRSRRPLPIHPSLQISAFLQDTLKNPYIPEETILQNLVEKISSAKDQDEAFSITELGNSLLKMVPKDKPLLLKFVLALRNNDPKFFYDEFGYSLFSTLESASMQTDSFFSLSLRIAHIFPHGDEEMLREVVRSLCMNIEETGVHLLPAKQPFSTDELRRRLTAFIGLQQLNAAFHCERRTYQALEKQKKGEFESLVSDIYESCRPNKTFDFESFKKYLKVLEECPRSLQVFVLVALRERLKTPPNKLPKDLDSLDPTNRIDDLPRLAQKVFEHFGVQTPEGLGEAPQDEALEITESLFIPHCKEYFIDPDVTDIDALEKLVEQIAHTKTQPEKPFSTTGLGNALSRLAPPKKTFLNLFVQALKKNDPTEFYTRIAKYMFDALASPSTEDEIQKIVELVFKISIIFSQERKEMREGKEPLKITERPFIAHRNEDLRDLGMTEIAALEKLVEQIIHTQTQLEESFSTTEWGNSLSQLVPEEKPFLYLFAQALKKNDPTEFYAEAGRKLFYLAETAAQEEASSRIIYLAYWTTEIFTKTRDEIRKTIVENLCRTISERKLQIIPPGKPFSPEKLKDSLSKFINLKKLAEALSCEHDVSQALKNVKNEEFIPLVNGIASYCRQEGVFSFERFTECMDILTNCPEQIQTCIIADLLDRLKTDGALPEELNHAEPKNKLKELNPIIRRIFKPESTR